MARLEQALSVGQIATFGFTTCDADDDPQEVLKQHPDFDQNSGPERRQGDRRPGKRAAAAAHDGRGNAPVEC